MTHRILTVALVATALLVPSSRADEPPAMPEMTEEQKAEMAAYMKAATPGPEHAALARTAGTYDVAMQSWHEPGGPAMKSTGTAKRSVILDGRVITEDFSGSMMDIPFTGHGMSGFDNVTGRHWSTWADTMGTGLMVTDGTCDAAMTCTFTGSWNDPVKKGPVKARMTTRWPSPTVQIFEMYGPAKDGTEMKMMELVYTKR